MDDWRGLESTHEMSQRKEQCIRCDVQYDAVLRNDCSCPPDPIYSIEESLVPKVYTRVVWQRCRFHKIYTKIVLYGRDNESFYGRDSSQTRGPKTCLSKALIETLE